MIHRQIVKNNKRFEKHLSKTFELLDENEKLLKAFENDSWKIVKGMRDKVSKLVDLFGIQYTMNKTTESISNSEK